MKFLSFVLIFVISSVLANPRSKKESNYEKINLEEIAKEVNSDHTSLWKADTYGFSEISVHEVTKKLGAKLRKNDKSTSNKNKHSKSKFSSQSGPKLGIGSGPALPRSYDARQRYPQCKSISHIRDQSACGSCWAVSAASAFSDRLCIRSKGRYNYELSSRFVLACDQNNYGCEGGYLDYAWNFLERNGTVTGGEFASDEGCQPYTLHPCGWPRKLACPWYLTPKCMKYKCDNENYSLTVEKNPIKEILIKLRTGYSEGTTNISYDHEIYNNGPVQAGFDVYADFIAYKSGIYSHKWRSRALGGHAVKIIGWGEEKGVKYWLIANSWGEDWGEDGTFRMIRGVNNCGIEDEVYAGNPKL